MEHMEIAADNSNIVEKSSLNAGNPLEPTVLKESENLVGLGDQQEDLIIKEDDPRYKNLEYIFSNYSYNNILLKKKDFTIYYKIPKELVLEEFETDYIKVKKDSDENFVNGRHIKRIVNLTCKLDIQSFYDTIVLHINNRINRPKCSICNKYIKNFRDLTHGYSNHENSHDKVYFCSTKHQLLYQAKIKVGTYSPASRNKIAKNWFINKGNKKDICILYLTNCNSKLKYGITEDIDKRIDIEKKLNLGEYKDIEILYKSDRAAIAEIEYYLREYYKGEEYLDINKEEFLSNYKIILNDYLRQKSTL